MTLSEFRSEIINLSNLIFKGMENLKRGRLSFVKMLSSNFRWADRNQQWIIECMSTAIGAPKLKSCKEIFSKMMSIALPMNLDIVERWELGEIGFEKAWVEACARKRDLWS